MKTALSLTIITICRNEPNIERTCQSIISQTWQDFEWIVIDGASTDGTLDILISEPDTGIYNAMNKGIRLAHGEFLNFMNGGDSFASSRTLEKIFAGGTESYKNYGVLYGDCIAQKDSESPRFVLFPRERPICRIIEGFSVNHQASFIRKKNFDKLGLYDEKYRLAGDYQKWLVFIKNKIRFFNLELVVSVFDMNGISMKNREKVDAEKNAAKSEVFSEKELKKIQRRNLKTVLRGQIFNKIELFKLSEDTVHQKRIFSLFGIPLLAFSRPPDPTEFARSLNGFSSKERLIFNDLIARIGRACHIMLPATSLHREIFPKYRGIHVGREVVVVGAGPTLDSYSPIPGAIHIGVNKTFLCEKLSLDYLFIQDYFEDTQDAADAYRPGLCKKFYGYHPHPKVRGIPVASATRANAERYFFEDLPTNDPAPFPFPPDISRAPFGTFASIIFPALQFALWTHPKRIYLVGCDCSSLGHCNSIISKTSAPQKLPLSVKRLLYGWQRMKAFIESFYPDVEIVSINPVGLKGMFNDIEMETNNA